MTTVQLLVCTLDDGIQSVAQLVMDPLPGVSYVVAWQHSQDDATPLPPSLVRDDVTVVEMNGCGLSRNRNLALDNATADVCVIADDDCRYRPEWIDAVRDAFDSHPQVDIATFRYTNAEQQKRYPDHEFDLRDKPRGYSVGSIEIAFRRASVQGRLRFNENFGLGAPVLQCGEEELFIHDALRMGLHCRYFPITIARHDHVTTQVSRAGDRGALMARGAFLYLGGYRKTMLLRPFTIAWQLHRAHGTPYWHAVASMFAGLWYAIRHPELT